MSRFRSLSRDDAGFSLLELVVVLIVLATLSSVAVASYNNFRKNETRKQDQVEIDKNGGCVRSHDVTTYRMSGDVQVPTKETICDEWQSPNNIQNPQKLR